MARRTILCPTDLSTQSKAGISHAITLARQAQAPLVVLHVIKFPVMEFARLSDADLLCRNRVSGFSIERLLKDATRRLSRFLQGAFRDPLSEIHWKPIARLGKVPAEIVAAAYQEDAGLIVMTRSEKGIIQQILASSISEWVTRKAPCAVLSVRPQQVLRSPRGGHMTVANGLSQGSEA